MAGTNMARSNNMLAPKSIDEAMSLSNYLAQSTMVPKAYINKPADIFVAMCMGIELGLNPIQSLQNIAVINGKPSIYGDAMLALVQSHPSFGGIEESFDEEKMEATCTVWRKGKEKYKHTVTFSKRDAENAGLWNKGTWQSYPKRMLQMRARGFALRDQFADALAGLISVEEARDSPLEERQEVCVNQDQVRQEQEVIEAKSCVDTENEIEKVIEIISGVDEVEQLVEVYKGLPAEMRGIARPLFTNRKKELEGLEVKDEAQ